MKCLVCGFNPFGSDNINSTELVIKLLRNKKLLDCEIHTLILPVAIGRAEYELFREIEHLKPDIVLLLGQDAGSSDIRIERLAINIDDFRIADNDGNQPKDRAIVINGPIAYFATLPIKKCLSECQASSLPVCISNSAGTFVCNHVFYALMHHLSINAINALGGFVHLPVLPEQARKYHNSPSMTAEYASYAIEKIIQAILI